MYLTPIHIFSAEWKIYHFTDEQQKLHQLTRLSALIPLIFYGEKPKVKDLKTLRYLGTQRKAWLGGYKPCKQCTAIINPFSRPLGSFVGHEFISAEHVRRAHAVQVPKQWQSDSHVLTFTPIQAITVNDKPQMHVFWCALWSQWLDTSGYFFVFKKKVFFCRGFKQYKRADVKNFDNFHIWKLSILYFNSRLNAVTLQCFQSCCIKCDYIFWNSAKPWRNSRFVVWTRSWCTLLSCSCDCDSNVVKRFAVIFSMYEITEIHLCHLY